MVKVLYVNGSLMDRGGISSFMMNCYLNIDPEKVKIDFAVLDFGSGQRNEEIYKRGGKIFNIVPKSKNLILHINQLKEIMAKGHYDIVHSQADAANALVLKIAKKENVAVRISHSHNSAYLTTNKIRIALNEIQRKLIPQYATALWACSDLAGRWLYGKRSFQVIHNGIDLMQYSFNSDTRYEKRNEIGIEQNGFAVIHVGKFDRQKNHIFILQVADMLRKMDPSIKVFLIGTGPQFEEIKDMAHNKSLSNLYFLGQRNDISQLINAFDCFILPSLFEGLSVAGVEAQANGIYCLFSDTITKEMKINENVEFLPIDDVQLWAERIVILKKDDTTRVFPNDKIHQYDIFKIAKKVEQYYINAAKGDL